MRTHLGLMVAAVTVIGLLAWSCGDDDTTVCPVGSEGCPCTTGGACNPPLACASNVCVTVGADADATDGDADADAPTCEGYADPTAGLCWEDPPSDTMRNWYDAGSYCEGLPGSWHLPSISELRSLIRGCPATAVGGACRVVDTCLRADCRDLTCDGCTSLSGPGAGGEYWPADLAGRPGRYWSSSSFADDTSFAWQVDFDTGKVGQYDFSKTDLLRVRCVRPEP